jgi:hypothetical protein
MSRPTSLNPDQQTAAPSRPATVGSPPPPNPPSPPSTSPACTPTLNPSATPSPLPPTQQDLKVRTCLIGTFSRHPLPKAGLWSRVSASPATSFADAVRHKGKAPLEEAGPSSGHVEPLPPPPPRTPPNFRVHGGCPVGWCRAHPCPSSRVRRRSGRSCSTGSNGGGSSDRP